jgi:hypothetical protein
MREITRIRLEDGPRRCTTANARTKFSKAEKEAAALERLMPKALKVLQERLDDEDRVCASPRRSR